MKKPEIWGISLSNYKLLEDSYGNRHIKGDIYYNGECVGFYDPIYQPNKDSAPEFFVKLIKSDFRDKFKNYESIFDFSGMTKYIDEDKTLNKGLDTLLGDLERLITLYETMSTALKDKKFIRVLGIINDEAMKVFPFMKLPPEDTDIVDFIQDKMGIYFDSSYPILVFEKDEDFIFDKPSIIM